jgi:NAD(P)H dehydrogenase (quinone)
MVFAKERPAMTHVAIVYSSTYGHTSKQAEAVAEGAMESSEVSVWHLPEDGSMPDGIWDDLAGADAIVFGGPTYMGGPPWQFKKFADATSEIWVNRNWQDKLAGGFTTSATVNGDKGECMSYFITLANQHGMLWVSLGQASPNAKEHGPKDMNWTGGNGGAMAIAPSDATPAEAPGVGDLASARAYGARIAVLAARFAG